MRDVAELARILHARLLCAGPYADTDLAYPELRKASEAGCAR